MKSEGKETTGQRIGASTWVCETCGVQSEPCVTPGECPICADERQYVAWSGQQWRAPDQVALDREIVFDDEHGVITMVLAPAFAINQRSFLIPHPEGQGMWECLATVTDKAVKMIDTLGGVTEIAISHPHFYGAMAEWSAALGDVPIYVHANGREWAGRRSPNLRFWEGPSLHLRDGIDLVHLGSHFAGSAGLLWSKGRARVAHCFLAMLSRS